MRSHRRIREQGEQRINVGYGDLAKCRQVAMQGWHSVCPSVEHRVSDISGLPSRRTDQPVAESVPTVGAGMVLESARQKLESLGQTEDLGMPKFLPWLPKPQQDRLEALVERELTKWVRRAERAHKAKRSRESKGRTPTKAR